MHVTRGRGRALPLRSPAQRHRPDDSVSKLTQLLCATLPESEFPPPWMMRGEARPPPEPVVPCEVQALLEGPRMAEDAAPALASLVREHFPRTHARHQLAYGDLGYDLETCGRTREARILAESGAYRDPPEARRTRRGGPTPTERRPEGCYPGSAADGPGVPFAESRTACRVAEVTRESCPLALFAHAHTSSRGGQQVLALDDERHIRWDGLGGDPPAGHGLVVGTPVLLGSAAAPTPNELIAFIRRPHVDLDRTAFGVRGSLARRGIWWSGTR